jgi:hypothetical protein
MVQAVEGFVVHHAAASGRLLQEHFNFQCGMVENHMTADADNKDFQTCKRLIELLSHSWSMGTRYKLTTMCVVLYSLRLIVRISSTTDFLLHNESHMQYLTFYRNSWVANVL